MPTLWSIDNAFLPQPLGKPLVRNPLLHSDIVKNAGYDLGSAG